LEKRTKQNKGGKLKHKRQQQTHAFILVGSVNPRMQNQAERLSSSKNHVEKKKKEHGLIE